MIVKEVIATAYRVAIEETGDASDKAVIVVLARIIASLVPGFSAGMAHTPK